jgi:HK97 family phage major capsid protein
MSMTMEQRFQAALTKARRMNDAAYKHGRTPTLGEVAALDEAMAEARALRSELDGRKALDALTAGMHLSGGSSSDPAYNDPPLGGYLTTMGGAMSFGREFVESEQYQQAKASGMFRSGGSWQTPPVEVKGVPEFKTTLLETPPGAGAALAQPDLQPGIIPLALPRVVVADLLPSGTTTSNAVRLMVESAFTNAAASVAEGAAKPESAMAFTQVDEPVAKLATWLPVSDEMLEDAAQLSSFIDARLISGIQLVEEQQLLNGSGTAPDLRGLLNRSGLAAPVNRTGSASNADAVLQQISAIEASGVFTVDGIILNPANWASIIGSKDSQGRYFGMGPLAPAFTGNFLWGRRVVTTPAIAAGTALVGAFRAAAQVFRRSGVDLSATNSHQDFFVKNLTAIRAEERLALAVFQPAALGTVTGLN